MFSLLSQPSSLAGFGLIGSLFNQLATQGVPSSSQGWFSLAAQALFGVAAIAKDDGSSKPKA